MFLGKEVLALVFGEPRPFQMNRESLAILEKSVNPPRFIGQVKCFWVHGPSINKLQSMAVASGHAAVASRRGFPVRLANPWSRGWLGKEYHKGQYIPYL